QVRVDVVDTDAPSPFARALVFAYTIAFMYEGDAPPAERRAQALTLDRALLRDLLGHEDLRRLLDPVVIDEVERERQGLAPRRRARDRDGLHALRRGVGALEPAELASRATEGGDPAAWLATLEQQGRAVTVQVGGRSRVAAAEDAPRYRAAAAGD